MFWNGSCTLQLLMLASLHGPHFGLIPVLLRLLTIELTYWTPAEETIAVLVIAAARVGLIYLLYRDLLINRWAKAAILLAGALFIFSPAQLSLFIYGDAGLPMGLDNFGFLLGLWGLIRYPHQWKGILIAGAGGLCSSFSWGVGMGWAVYGLVLLRQGRVRPSQTGFLLACFLLTLWPLEPLLRNPGSHTVLSLFNLRYMLGTLGRPLSAAVDRIDDYPYAFAMGLTGLGMLVATGFVVARQAGRRLPAPFVPGAVLIAYGLGCVYEVSVFRDGVGSWYTALSSNFWIGLAGSLIVLLERGAGQRPVYLFAGGMLAGLGGLFLCANSSFADKTSFLNTRSLSATACLVHYRDAPTSCEMLISQNMPTYQFQKFARFFEETGLSAFGRQQTWTLQGDYLLKSVELQEQPGRPSIDWVEPDRLDQPVSWESADRLSLALAAGNRIDWQVDLSGEVKSAVFAANVRKLYGHAQPDITVVAKDGAITTILAQPVTKHGREVRFSLDAFLGQQVDIVFSALPDNAAGAGMLIFDYPRIEAEASHHPQAVLTDYGQPVSVMPSNVDQAPAPTSGDLAIPVPADLRWRDFYGPPFSPELPHPAACLGDYSQLVLSMALPSAIDARVLRVDIQARAQNKGVKSGTGTIVLQPDAGHHDYSFDLRLLGLDNADHIEAITLSSPWGKGPAAEQPVKVGLDGLRLIRKNNTTSFCSEHA